MATSYLNYIINSRKEELVSICFWGIRSVMQMKLITTFDGIIGNYMWVEKKSIDLSRINFQRVLISISSILENPKFSIDEKKFTADEFFICILSNNWHVLEMISYKYIQLHPILNKQGYADVFALFSSLLLNNKNSLNEYFSVNADKYDNSFDKGILLFGRALYEQDEPQMLEAIKMMCKHSDKIQPMNSFQMVFPPEINALVMFARKRGFVINYKHRLIHDDFINDPFIPEPDEYFIPYIKSWNLLGMLRVHKKYLK